MKDLRISSNLQDDTAVPQHLYGPEYITSDEKLQFDMALGHAVLPLARAVSAVTELTIYVNLLPEHRFVQVREGVDGAPIAIPKIRTMHHVPEGQLMDIQRYSVRIINQRAHLARNLGFDELPQWGLVANGEMSAVGPRPLLGESKDMFSKLAEVGGMSTERVEEWREFLKFGRPGIFGKSQTLRHRKSLDENTPTATVRMIETDLAYKANASRRHDVHIILGSIGMMVYENLRRRPT